MIQNLKAKKDDIRLLVLSKVPKKTEETYGVYSLNRYNLTRIKKELKRSHLFIFGGGSLIQDVTSDKSLWYYLNILKLAISTKIPVMLYANGIGPVNKKKNRDSVAKILNKVDVITLRDEASLDTVKDMGVLTDVTVTADPALTMEGLDACKVRELLRDENIPDGENFIGISIRDWKDCNEDFWKEVAQGVDEICKKYCLSPLWIPLKHPDDVEMSKKVQSKMDTKGYILEKSYTAEEIVGITGFCKFVIGMRLHSLIYSASCKVPAISIAYDPKVSGFADYMGTSTAIEINDFIKEKLISEAENIIQNYDEIKKILEEKKEIFKQKAEKTADIAIELIKNI